MKATPFFTPDWKWGTAEGSREFDRLSDRMMTFSEKLQWLEDAENLTLAFAAAREKLKAHEAQQEAEE
jgi:hypothetical protein